jgi:hypothetical protein
MTNIVVTTLSAGQTSKEATISQMVAELDAGVTDFLSLDATSGNVSVSSSNLKSHSKFRVFGHTVARTLTFTTPVKRGVVVENAGTAALSVIVGSTTLSLAAASAMLYYLDGTTNGIAVSVTAGATTFAGLTDVNVPTPADKSALIYDSASGKWIAALWPVTTQSGTTYTFVLADANSTVESTSASATAFTIPANATVAFNVGTEIECIQQGAGLLTISPAAGVTLHGTALVTTTQYQRVKLRKIATNEWNCAVIGSGTGGGGSTTLAALTDVNVTEGSGIDGQYLKWDNATSKWIPGTPSGGGGGSGGAPLYENGAFAPPQASWFSTLVGGPGTVTRTDVSMQGMSQKVTGGTGQDQIHLAARSTSGWGTAWKVRARLAMANNMAQFPTLGIWAYDSGSSKLQGIIYENSSTGGNVHIQSHTNLTTFSSNNTTWNTNEGPEWFEMELVSGNLKFRVSWDGVIWQEHSFGATSFLPAITHVGIGGTAFTNDGPTINPVGFLCTYYDDPDFPASGHTVTLGSVVGTGDLTIAKLTSNSSAYAWDFTNVISWNSATGAAWASGNPTRFTTPSGKSKVRFTVGVTMNSGSNLYLFVKRNGSTSEYFHVTASISTGQVNFVTPWLDVTAGDYFEIGINPSSTGNFALSRASVAAVFSSLTLAGDKCGTFCQAEFV